MQPLPKSEHKGATLLLASALYVNGRTALQGTILELKNVQGPTDLKHIP